MESDEEQDSESVINILVASDIHLGYKETSGVLGKDSFVTFDEIFKIAQQRKVDFILLGGDLFHENKPSRKCLHNAMETMKRYCWGNRPCQVEVVSDQSVNFGHTSRTISSVNYENPNLNIGMPVFSIHGNHDDPTGVDELSAIDLLSVAGLLNHFGKPTSLEQIDISPVLMKKGNTKLALYGLGSVRDERLHRLFTHDKVKILRPKEDMEEWFNIMVLHQNRSAHGPTNYIPEHFLDECFDLVVWGHEHECRVEPEYNSLKNFYVIQTGSPVATSLCPGESKKKCVALVKIRGREMKCEAIPLQTPRQMYVEDIKLSECSGIPPPTHAKVEERIQAYLKNKIESLIERAAAEHSGHPKQPTKPLIRLRVDTSGGYSTFSVCRFGAKFTDQVANPDKIVRFLNKKRSTKKNGDFDVSSMDDIIAPSVAEKVQIEDLVNEFLNSKEEKQRLDVLSARGLTEAVSEYVYKNEKQAVGVITQHQLDKTKHYLMQLDGSNLEQTIDNEVVKLKLEREAAASMKKDDKQESIQEIIKQAQQEGGLTGGNTTDMISDGSPSDDDEDNQSNASRTSRGRGRGSRGGRSSRGQGSKSTRGRGAKKQTSNNTSIMDALTSTQSRKTRTTQSSSKKREAVTILSSDDENLFAQVTKKSKR